MTQRTPWLVFAAALALGVAVMAWVTVKLVGLERERSVAELRGARSEQVRSALWRIDARATPLLLQEISMLASLGDPAAEAALGEPPDWLRARFVLPDGGKVRIVGCDDGDDPRQTQLAALLDDDQLLAALPEPVEGAALVKIDNPINLGLQSQYAQVGQPVGPKGTYSEAEDRARGIWELQRRIESLDNNAVGYGNSIANTLSANGLRDDGLRDDGMVDGGGGLGGGGLGEGGLGGAVEAGAVDSIPRALGAVRPVWVTHTEDGETLDELLLLRRARGADGDAVHGTWLDWPRLRALLLHEAVDVLPEARLVAVPSLDAIDDPEGLLASLPARLLAGELAVHSDALSTLAPSLVLGWAGMLAAALAVFAVLRWSLALSERRATFVSVVTHELRTPLTTFRMYAEMLEEGMVDEAKRKRYVGTLRREADRLGDLVENVLAYARIESDRAPLAPETLTCRALLDRMSDRLGERAASAGLQLSIELPEALADTELRVDPTAAEQILFNLVDNAAKYAPSEAEPRIELSAHDAGSHLAITVRDHGHGIPPAEHRTIFDPFTKATADASGTKPGVGLGLALSRRLARQLQGDLTIEDAHPGARFTLTLPRA